jgi:hypothetical protein
MGVDDVPKKWKRCVRKVKAKNAGKPESEKVNPYAVCTKSTGQTRHKTKKKKK